MSNHVQNVGAYLVCLEVIMISSLLLLAYTVILLGIQQNTFLCNEIVLATLQNVCSCWCALSYRRWGTAATVPPPFRLGDPALCGSHPLVTPLLV